MFPSAFCSLTSLVVSKDTKQNLGRGFKDRTPLSRAVPLNHWLQQSETTQLSGKMSYWEDEQTFTGKHKRDIQEGKNLGFAKYLLIYI